MHPCIYAEMVDLQFYVFSNSISVISGQWEGENEIDGWMACDFTSFSTVFQSYQDDDWMIMKGCVQWNSVYG